MDLLVVLLSFVLFAVDSVGGAAVRGGGGPAVG